MARFPTKQKKQRLADPENQSKFVKALHYFE
jgi:hypothetical protein